jgi:hypothetical protein
MLAINRSKDYAMLTINMKLAARGQGGVRSVRLWDGPRPADAQRYWKLETR